MSNQFQQVEVLIEKATKYAEENPLIVGGASLVTLLTSIAILQRPSMSRDGNDYQGQLSGSLKLLNNQDHTLKSHEFKSSINDYENMFDGARKSTGTITNEESVELRKQRYADMVNHFYNLVTDFYEW